MDREVAEERPSSLVLDEQLDSSVRDTRMKDRAVRYGLRDINRGPTLRPEDERAARGSSSESVPPDDR